MHCDARGSDEYKGRQLTARADGRQLGEQRPAVALVDAVIISLASTARTTLKPHLALLQLHTSLKHAHRCT